MSLKKMVVLMMTLGLTYAIINRVIHSARSSAIPVTTDARQSEWAVNNSFGFPVWIALNFDHKMGYVRRSIFLFIEAQNFSEDNMKKVFTGLSTQYPVPEDLFIKAYSDKEMLQRAIDNHLSTTHVNYGNSPEDRERAEKLTKDFYPSDVGYFRADYLRSKEGGEKFSYSPDPNKVDRITAVLKERPIPYTGEINSDFLLATRECDIAKIRALLDKGANVNTTDSEGNTALMIATVESYNGHSQSEVIRMLLARGADVNARNLEGWTALTYGASSDDPDPETMQLLIAKGADVNAKNKYGDAPLTLSAYNGHMENVNILLSKGASINARNEDGNTPLIRAVQNNQIEIVGILITKGADLNVKNDQGETALIWAQEHDMREIVELFKKTVAANKLHSSAKRKQHSLQY